MTPSSAQAILTPAFAPWINALDITVASIDQSHAHLSMPITDDITRVGGIVCGQAMTALADTAIVFAGFGHAQEFIPFATTTLDTQFLRAGQGDIMHCRAEVVKPGRSLYFCRATITVDASDKPIALATATLMRP